MFYREVFSKVIKGNTFFYIASLYPPISHTAVFDQFNCQFDMKGKYPYFPKYIWFCWLLTILLFGEGEINLRFRYT